MITRIRILAAAGAFGAILAAGPARADLSSVGGLGSAIVFSASGKTYVDLTRGATATGTYSSATIYWTGADALCTGTGSFTLKFYHPDASTREHLTFIDERGPFNATSGLVDVALSPPVSLEQGDLVGITEIVSGDCGAVAMLRGGGNPTLQFEGDSGTSNITICDQSFATLISETPGVLVRGSGTFNRAGIVLGVGSVQGAAGSNFKTSMQLLNPGGAVTIQGFLIFRALGRPGGPTDPLLAYSIAPNAILSFPDIVSAIGGSGLGSIDVIASSSYAPLVATRIFSDGGDAGTAGFSEPMVRPGDEFVIDTFDTAFLLGPADPAKFRMNLAIRSLASATLEITVAAPDGTFVAQATKSYDPDVFDLESTAQLFPGAVIGANDVIRVYVTAGRAIVGGVSVDNKTNDTALQLGTRLHF